MFKIVKTSPFLPTSGFFSAMEKDISQKEEGEIQTYAIKNSSKRVRGNMEDINFSLKSNFL